MCAIEAGKRGRKVIVVDHSNKPGKKILMSGGGRCNFTNYFIHPDHFISHNPHFCKSALSRYTQWDFIALVQKHGIPYHEKTLGQLFCDDKSKDILRMLLSECEALGVEIQLNRQIETIEKISKQHFKLQHPKASFQCQSLVVACGGLSIPSLGASAFGYKIAEQFGIKVWPTRAGLVPLTLHTEDKEKIAPLSGIGLPSIVSIKQHHFRENMLFTHRGISGPAILQISSYWKAGEAISINLLPDIDLIKQLKLAQKNSPIKQVNTFLSQHLPKKCIELLLKSSILEKKLADVSHQEFEQIAAQIQDWSIKPNGTEGYRSAEVTLGGVDCDAISSKTMEAIDIPGLYFIGEVLDVAGCLGGFNFQWAWSSGWAAGQVV